MTALEQAIAVARAEALERTRPVTRQILAPHEMALRDGQPVVARVSESGSGLVFVYLRIEGYPYFFVVEVKTTGDGALALSSVGIATHVRAYLAIGSGTVPPEEISRWIGFGPTSTVRKGDLRGRSGAAVHDRHVWMLEPRADVPGTVEEKVGWLLDEVERASDRIAALRPECWVSLNVVDYGWRGDPQFGGGSFEPEAVARIAGLGAALDCDLYATGPEMPGEEPEEE